MSPRHKRKITWPRITRDGMAIILGFAIGAHEAFYTTGDRVSVWGAVLGLIFGPVYWRRLDAQRDQDKKAAEEAAAAKARQDAKDDEAVKRATHLAELLDGLEWLRDAHEPTPKPDPPKKEDS